MLALRVGALEDDARGVDVVERAAGEHLGPEVVVDDDVPRHDADVQLAGGGVPQLDRLLALGVADLVQNKDLPESRGLGRSAGDGSGRWARCFSCADCTTPPAG